MAMGYKWVGKCFFILLKEYSLKDIRKERKNPKSNSCLINQGIVIRTPSSLANGHEGSLSLYGGSCLICSTWQVSGAQLGVLSWNLSWDLHKHPLTRQPWIREKIPSEQQRAFVFDFRALLLHTTFVTSLTVYCHPRPNNLQVSSNYHNEWPDGCPPELQASAATRLRRTGMSSPETPPLKKEGSKKKKNKMGGGLKKNNKKN